MATARSLLILMGDDVAGILVRSPGGSLAFEYDESYRTGSGATPLSVSMPLQRRVHPHRVVEPWLWGLLPDNARVLDAWARRYHVSSSNPFSLLSSPVGEDCPGAVRVIDAQRLDALVGAGPGDDDIAWLTEEDVAGRIRDLVTNTTSWLGSEGTGRFSLAGAQPKTALVLRDGRWGDPQGATATTHILKPAVQGLDEHDLNEHLCLAAKRVIGIPAVRTAVQRFGDQSAVVVRRYDRRQMTAEAVQRIHQEDLAQALGHHPTAKYQNEGGPGVADVARLLRSVETADESVVDVESFVRALVWNWIIAGTDAHAKNYALLLSGSQVALAPFYDVASALPYPDMPVQKLRFAMKFGTGYRVNPGSPPWSRLAADTGLSPGRVVEIAGELVERAADAFATVAAMPEVTALGSDLPGRLAGLVEARTRICRALL